MNMLAKYNRPMTPREKRIRNQFGTMFIIATLTALWLMVMWSNQNIENSKQKVDLGALQHQLDSLHDETFNLSNALGRYELTLEYLKEVDPKAAKKFNDYMSHETE
jgi:hypothetical protein